MDLRRQVSRFLNWWHTATAKPIVPSLGRLTAPDDMAGRISDGVNYSQPVLLPAALRETLERQGRLSEYLTEAARDTYRFQFDTPQRGGDDLPIAPPTEDPLREWSWSTRKDVLTNCHAAYNRNPVANTAVQYTADFVLGEGMNLTCKNKRVQEFLEEFLDDKDNGLREYERQAVIDLQVDGELFLRLFEQAGRVITVPLRPWECEAINTELGFFRRVLSYVFQVYQTSGSEGAAGETRTERLELDAEDVLHVAINRHSYELRGRPELFRVLPWLRADKEFQENTARQHHWRNALLWFVKVTGANAAQLAAVISRWSKPPTPGSIAVESGNVDVQPLVNPAGSGNATEDGRQLRLRPIVGLRLPEYFFGDGYNANLATATAQQVPALTKFSGFQRTMIECLWYPLFTRALQVAMDAGLLPSVVEEQDMDGDPLTDDDTGATKTIETLKAFEVSYSPISSESDLTIAQALNIAAANGWVDKVTAQERLGLDPYIVAKRMDREKDAAEPEMKRPESATPDEMMGPAQEKPAEDETGQGEAEPEAAE